MTIGPTNIQLRFSDEHSALGNKKQEIRGTPYLINVNVQRIWFIGSMPRSARVVAPKDSMPLFSPKAVSLLFCRPDSFLFWRLPGTPVHRSLMSTFIVGWPLRDSTMAANSISSSTSIISSYTSAGTA